MSHFEIIGLCLAAYWVGLALHLTIKNSIIAAFRISQWLWARRPRFVYLVPKYGNESFVNCVSSDVPGAGDSYQVILTDGVYLVTFCDWINEPVKIYSENGQLEGYEQRQYMDKIVRAYRAGRVLHGA